MSRFGQKYLIDITDLPLIFKFRSEAEGALGNPLTQQKKSTTLTGPVFKLCVMI